MPGFNKADFEESFDTELEKLRERNLYRETKIHDPELINFSSNDYLGLAQRALELKVDRRGASASRITSGSYQAHKELEEFIADWKGTEAALVFSSGYMANLGTLSVILGSKDIVFCDEYSHACILDGIRLSGAHKYFYKHNDIEHLRELLEKHRDKFAKALIVTEAVFSMDGDKAQLAQINPLAKKFNCSLYIDEAHGTGVLGSNGAGLVEELSEQGLIKKSDVLVQMGTFSKAIGLEGGYIAGSKSLIEFLKNKSRTFIYSTAISPLLSGLILEHLTTVRYQPELRASLNAKIQLFQTHIAGLKYSNENTAIFAIHMPSVEAALSATEELKKQGYLVIAIRPPTVPSPRLRVCINANHRDEDIENLAELLKAVRV